jgi:FtsP/CotA-like multicopper oxidase with cupredoxin domain
MYHAHSGLVVVDGGLVVDPWDQENKGENKKKEEEGGHDQDDMTTTTTTTRPGVTLTGLQYDDERILMFQDWWDDGTVDEREVLKSLLKPQGSGGGYRWIGEPDSVLVNGVSMLEGKGRCKPFSNTTGTTTTSNSTTTSITNSSTITTTTGDSNNKNDVQEDAGGNIAVIQVQPFKSYRLRLIAATSLSTLYFQIEGHSLTVFEMDGHEIQPVRLKVGEGVELGPGQRVSVLVDTEQGLSVSDPAGGGGNGVKEFLMSAEVRWKGPVRKNSDTVKMRRGNLDETTTTTGTATATASEAVAAGASAAASSLPVGKKGKKNDAKVLRGLGVLRYVERLYGQNDVNGTGVSFSPYVIERMDMQDPKFSGERTPKVPNEEVEWGKEFEAAPFGLESLSSQQQGSSVQENIVMRSGGFQPLLQSLRFPKERPVDQTFVFESRQVLTTDDVVLWSVNGWPYQSVPDSEEPLLLQVFRGRKDPLKKDRKNGNGGDGGGGNGDGGEGVVKAWIPIQSGHLIDVVLQNTVGLGGVCELHPWHCKLAASRFVSRCDSFSRDLKLFFFFFNNTIR